MPRPTFSSPARRSALALRPSDRGVELPEWLPSASASGWTPRAVWVASARYAEEHADPAQRRRAAALATRTLLGALAGVKRSELEDRTRGVDHGADTLASFTDRPLDSDDL